MFVIGIKFTQVRFNILPFQRSFAVIFTKIDSRSCLRSAVEFDAGFDADVAEAPELSSLFLRNRISIFLNPFN